MSGDLFKSSQKGESRNSIIPLLAEPPYKHIFPRNLLCFCVEIEFEAAGHSSEISVCLVVWACAVIWSHQLPLCRPTLRLMPKLHVCPAIHDRNGAFLRSLNLFEILLLRADGLQNTHSHVKIYKSSQ